MLWQIRGKRFWCLRFQLSTFMWNAYKNIRQGRIKHDLSVFKYRMPIQSNLSSYHTNMSKKDTLLISSDTPLWHQDYLIWNNLSSEWIGRIDLANHVKDTSSPGTGLDSIWDVPGFNTLVGRCVSAVAVHHPNPDSWGDETPCRYCR